MKKVIYGIIIIIFVLIGVIVLSNIPITKTIDGGPASVSSETIINFNKGFEDFSKLKNYNEIKEFLEFCKLNCEYHQDEPAFVPVINYMSNDEEIHLTYEIINNYSFKDTEYYIELEKLIEKVKENKFYNIEFSYVEVKEDRPQMIREINIIEKNDNN